MIINTRMEDDGSVVLTITERSLTNANATEFRELAKPEIEASSGEIVVDCSGVEFIDSSGVGALLHVNSLMPTDRRPVRLVGVGKKLLASLELMRVHRQFALEPKK